MTNKPEVRLRPVYDKPTGEDGTRVLVDRGLAAGLSKDKARIDQWYKQVAPSTELRKWYAHDPRGSRSSPAGTGRAQGSRASGGVDQAAGLAWDQTVTLVTATKPARSARRQYLRT
jgi:uncharacterized protein YeaO (DUF488 family)